MLIKLVRHGLSKANTNEVDPLVIGDFRVPLCDAGIEQARAAGARLGADFLRSARIYTSPYLRARDPDAIRNATRGAVHIHGQMGVDVKADLFSGRTRNTGASPAMPRAVTRQTPARVGPRRARSSPSLAGPWRSGGT